MSGNDEPAGGKNEQDDLDQYQAVQPDVAGMLGEERHVALESGDDERFAGCGGQRHAPYGISSSAPIRWANVPTKAEATPAAIVINDLTSAFWRYDHGRNSVVLFTVMRFSIGGDMTW